MPRSAIIRAGALALLALVHCAPCAAREAVLGVGAGSFGGGPRPALLDLELHADPLIAAGAFTLAPAAGASITPRGDLWMGGGLALRLALGGSWFLEASAMPGLHRPAGPSTDLGHPVEFRSLAGIGRRVGRAEVSLAASHLSNAGLGGDNPGMNGLTLRVRRPF